MASDSPTRALVCRCGRYRRDAFVIGALTGAAVVVAAYALSPSSDLWVLDPFAILLWFACLLGAVVARRSVVRWALAGVVAASTVTGAVAVLAFMARLAIRSGGIPG